jgi:uncharacterized protein YdaU (DUF1376 family)
MAEFPALPLWTDAYLADCGHLSDAENGRYIFILLAMWRAPNQRLPNDDDWLARKFRKTVEEVKTDLRPLIREFCQCDGNWITQKRLLREWEYVKKTSERQREAAKSRWVKEKDLSHGNAGRHASGNAPTPTPTPSEEKKDLQRASARQTRGTRLSDDWQPDESDQAYALKFHVDPRTEAEAFRDYWHAKAGANAVKLNWAATWRTWCRNSQKFKGGNGNGQAAKRNGIQEVLNRKLAELGGEEGPRNPLRNDPPRLLPFRGRE